MLEEPFKKKRRPIFVWVKAQLPLQILLPLFIEVFTFRMRFSLNDILAGDA